MLSLILAEISSFLTEKVLMEAAPVALAEMGFKKIFKTAGDSVRKFNKDKHLQDNGDLIKALRIAMIEATIKMKKAIFHAMEEDAAGSPLTDDKNKRAFLENKFNEWIDQELKQAANKARNDEIETSAYKNVELLLNDPKNDDASKMRNAIANVCKKEWLVELKNGLKENIPPLTESFLFYGWNENNIPKNWFDITSFLFGQILKQDEYKDAKTAFDTKLLSNISTELGIVSLKIDRVFDLLNTETRTQLVEIKEILYQINNSFKGIGDSFAYIKVLDLQNLTIKTFPINKKKIIIGRGPQCDIQLNDNDVSRYHASVFINKTNFSILDSNSTNGTFVENKKLEYQKEHEFSYGTTFKIGNLNFSVLSSNIDGKDLISTPTKII